MGLGDGLTGLGLGLGDGLTGLGLGLGDGLSLGLGLGLGLVVTAVHAPKPAWQPVPQYAAVLPQ